VLKQSNTVKIGAVHVPSIVYLDNNKQCPPKSHVHGCPTGTDIE